MTKKTFREYFDLHKTLNMALFILAGWVGCWIGLSLNYAVSCTLVVPLYELACFINRKPVKD